MGFDAPEIVWSQCQSQLQNELPEQQYNTWIRPLKLKYFDTDNDRFNDPSNDDVIELLAPNRFVEDWVKSKFLNRIEELFHQLSGNGVVLGISASPLNEPQYKQQAEIAPEALKQSCQVMNSLKSFNHRVILIPLLLRRRRLFVRLLKPA